jgi:hypothetical protein
MRRYYLRILRRTRRVRLTWITCYNPSAHFICAFCRGNPLLGTHFCPHHPLKGTGTGYQEQGSRAESRIDVAATGSPPSAALPHRPCRSSPPEAAMRSLFAAAFRTRCPRSSLCMRSKGQRVRKHRSVKEVKTLSGKGDSRCRKKVN